MAGARAVLVLGLLVLRSHADNDGAGSGDEAPEAPEPEEPLASRPRRAAAVEKKTEFPIQLLAGGFRGGGDLWQLRRPYGVARDSSGNTYVSDTMNHRVQRWVSMDQAGETVAGTGAPGGGLDQLKFPRGIWLEGDVLYIADSGNHRIVSWNVAAGDTSGTLVAGELGVLYDRQGQILGYESTCCRGGSGAAQLLEPFGMFVASSGDLYIADTGNDRIVHLSGGVSSVLAGVGMPSPGANSALRRPEGVFVLGTSLYVADTDQHRVLQYGLSGGDGTVVAGGNGVGSDLNQLSSPAQLFVDDSEQESGSAVVHIYVVDTDNHRVMKIREDTGDATEVAGGCLESPNYIVPCIQGGVHDPPRPWPDNMEELNPSSDNPPIYHFWGPSGLHVDVSTMDITVADSLNHRVLVWEAAR